MATEIEHAEWCSRNIEDVAKCDCGGNGARCVICGAEGPCAFTDDGEALIHVAPAALLAGFGIASERPPTAEAGE